MKAVPSVVLSLSVFATVASAKHLPDGKRSNHTELTNKVRAAELGLEERSEDHTLHKRFGPGRMTFYNVGLGACGWWNNPGDYIVAVNSAQFGGYAVYPPLICGKQITISYNGKQVGATVADECPTCGYGELDLSRGLFNNFAGENDGVFYAEWWFNDGNSNPQPQPQPTTTQEPPPPTTTWTPQSQPMTTTQQQAPPPTTSSNSEPASSSTSHATSSSVSSSGGFNVATVSTSSNTPMPSSGPETETKQNIQEMGSFVVQIGRLITHAAGRELTVNAN